MIYWLQTFVVLILFLFFSFIPNTVRSIILLRKFFVILLVICFIILRPIFCVIVCFYHYFLVTKSILGHYISKYREASDQQKNQMLKCRGTAIYYKWSWELLSSYRKKFHMYKFHPRSMYLYITHMYTFAWKECLRVELDVDQD